MLILSTKSQKSKGTVLAAADTVEAKYLNGTRVSLGASDCKHEVHEQGLRGPHSFGQPLSWSAGDQASLLTPTPL